MKKILSIILSMLMLLSNSCLVLANEKSELYAYTTNTGGFDAYAKEELSTHIYTYYGYIDNTLKLGQGIKVLGKEIPTVLYPVWKNNEIVATFNVIYYGGQYSGSYSNGNVEQLNHAKEIATIDNPIKLVKTDEAFMYIIDDVAYDMTDGYGKVLSDVNAYILSSEKLTKIDTAATLEYSQINIRAAASWNLSWNPSEHNGNIDNKYIYAYCLSPVLRSLGESTYTVSKIKAGLNNAYIVNITQLRNYITNQGFLSQFSTSGSMDSTNVINWIYSNRKHIITGLGCVNNSSISNSYGVITGYSSTGSSYTYSIYHPQHNGVNGKCTMSASTKTFTNSDGNSFVWNAGYITNIR